VSAPRPEVCVGAIAVDSNRILLIRRGTAPGAGQWSVPGGRVERGETIQEAVLRELREETALEGVAGALVGWVERVGPDHHFVILDFAVRVTSTQPPSAGDDVTDARWIPFAELGSLDLVPGLLEFLRVHAVVPPS